MVIKYHHRYLRRLAEVYLQKYSMHGFEKAAEWYDNFLDDGIRARIRPFIEQVADEQNLEVD